MANPLDGKVALVTGASSGIGEATAIALAREGAAVAVSARRADRLAGLVQRIEAAGGKAMAVPGDVADEATAKLAVEQTVKQLGRIDILVNNAGIIRPGGVENADTEMWRYVMDVNFMSALYTSSAAVTHMRDQGGGQIINVTSNAGRRPAAVFGCYSPSKYALTSMSEGMRQELAKYNIRVSIVAPGATATEVAESIDEPNVREFMRNHTHKEDAMLPEDVASAILFIATLPPRANVSDMYIRPTTDINS